MENADTKWISQKMFTYQDPETTVQLNVIVESGIIQENGWSNYCSLRTTIQLKDNRTQANSKTQIELHFPELNTLVEKLENAFKNGPKKVYDGNTVIPIIKYLNKNKKDLVFTFSMINSKPSCSLEISDPTSSGSSKKLIYLDYQTYVSVSIFLKQVRDNYAVIATNFMNVAVQEKILDQLKNLKIPSPTIQSVPKEEVEPDFGFVGKPTVQGETAQSFFNQDVAGNIDSIQLPEEVPFSLPPIKVEPAIEKTKMPFIGNFLGYEPMKLSLWVTAFLHAEEKSQDAIFCPFNVIMKQSLEEMPAFAENGGFLKVQYFLDIMFRRSVKSYLKDGKFIAYPILQLSEQYKIKRGTELWDLSCEVLFTFIVFSNICNNYLKYLSLDKDQKAGVTEIVLCQNFLRSYLSFFVVSLADEDRTYLKDDLVSILSKCYKNGFLEKFSILYSDMTKGGKLDFSQAVMTGFFENFLSNMHRIPIFSPNQLTNLFQENNIPDCGQIKNINEVKLFVLKIIGMETQPISDGRLELFLNCIKKYADPTLMTQLGLKCKRYVDLTSFFQGVNVPDELWKIKRTMDRNTSLTRKADIMKEVASLNEESSVSQTRVMFDADTQVPVDKETDLESVISSIIE